MNDTDEIEGYLINGIVEFFPEKRLLIRKDTAQSVVLHAPASGCLMSLIENKPEVVSQSNLIMAGWRGLHEHVSPNTFYQSILGLRQSLEDIGLEKNLIMTVRRRGLLIPTNNTITPISMGNTVSQSTLSGSDVAPGPKKTDTLYPSQKNKLPILLGKKGVILIFILIVSIISTILTAGLPLIQNSEDTPGEYFSDFYKLQFYETCNIYVKNPMVNYESYIAFIKTNELKCDQRAWWYISADINSPRISLVRCVNSIIDSEKNYCSTDYYYERE